MNEETPTCKDSTLTKASNILQILTFIFALTIAIQLLSISLRTIQHHTPNDISYLTAALEIQVINVRSLATKLQARRSHIHGSPAVEEQLNVAMQRVQGPLHDSEALVKRLHEQRGGKRGLSRIVRGRHDEEAVIKGSLERMKTAVWVLEGVEKVILGDPGPKEHEQAFRSRVLQMMDRMMYEILDLREIKAPKAVREEM